MSFSKQKKMIQQTASDDNNCWTTKVAARIDRSCAKSNHCSRLIIACFSPTFWTNFINFINAINIRRDLLLNMYQTHGLNTELPKSDWNFGHSYLICNDKWVECLLAFINRFYRMPNQIPNIQSDKKSLLNHFLSLKSISQRVTFISM